MKIASALIATALGIAVTAPALAEHTYRLNDASLSQSTNAAPGSYGGAVDGNSSGSSPGKTRAQVYGELMQAQKDGVVPSNKTDYPPSQRTVQHNREQYRLRH
ncbi:DUF4148 domain-containing protein [Caballeronia sp. LZ024]|uniref:DUF4148 domain-containing protein n=2 Tax=unclassified Caballeronia TaxID=2646786 RepID=UPI0028653E18|nr:DUF4148 domain-containing protein [Caballeronia sp. LZ024]MDR5751301.1 DUF4148 domain-containing protein [Caballeronia sp. LZ024]MDR5844561.1 DUF4148 domain-containing protein [Caballeronia sp. LZ031]